MRKHFSMNGTGSQEVIVTDRQVYFDRGSVKPERAIKLLRDVLEHLDPKAAVRAERAEALLVAMESDEPIEFSFTSGSGGNELMNRRRALGITLGDAARSIGWDAPRASQVETGRADDEDCALYAAHLTTLERVSLGGAPG